MFLTVNFIPDDPNIIIVKYTLYIMRTFLITII